MLRNARKDDLCRPNLTVATHLVLDFTENRTYIKFILTANNVLPIELTDCERKSDHMPP